MPFPVTTLYSLPLAVIFLVLFMRVVQARVSHNVSLGDGGHEALLERIRCHGNFVEWVPMVLILMVLAEAAGANSIALHTAGGLLVVGRLAHPFGLKARNGNNPLRLVGNLANMIATVILIALLSYMRL